MRLWTAAWGVVVAVGVAGCARDPCDDAQAYIEGGASFARLEDATIGEGQTLRVCPGTYEVADWYPFRAEEFVASGFTLPASYSIVGAGSGSTILRSVSRDKVIRLYPADTLTVAGIALEDGQGAFGASCTDEVCEGPYVCAGTTVFDGHATFRDVVFENNTADYGAGLCVGQSGWGLGTERTPTVTLESVTFRGNTATEAGGALLINGDAFVEATDTTWGEGGADNVPDDIAILPHTEDYAERMELLASYSFDGTVDVECDGAAGVCR